MKKYIPTVSLGASAEIDTADPSAAKKGLNDLFRRALHTAYMSMLEAQMKEVEAELESMFGSLTTLDISRLCQVYTASVKIKSVEAVDMEPHHIVIKYNVLMEAEGFIYPDEPRLSDYGSAVVPSTSHRRRFERVEDVPVTPSSTESAKEEVEKHLLYTPVKVSTLWKHDFSIAPKGVGESVKEVVVKGVELAKRSAVELRYDVKTSIAYRLCALALLSKEIIASLTPDDLLLENRRKALIESIGRVASLPPDLPDLVELVYFITTLNAYRDKAAGIDLLMGLKEGTMSLHLYLVFRVVAPDLFDTDISSYACLSELPEAYISDQTELEVLHQLIPLLSVAPPKSSLPKRSIPPPPAS